MLPKFYVSLVLVDENIDPDDVTRSTGIQPFRIWHKGEIRPKTALKEKDNGWELKSYLSPEVPLAEHVSSILSLIEPSISRLQAFTRNHYALLACAIYFQDEPPEIHFDAHMIRRLADLNLRLDVDLYCVE